MVFRQRLVIPLVAIALCLPASADRAKDAYKHGVRLEHQADYDAAFGYYKQAYTLAPTNAKYFAAYTHARFNAATQHVHTGQVLRNTGALAEALAHFQRAAEIDSTNFVAQQEMRRTADMIKRQEHQRSAPKVEAPPSRLPDDFTKSVELQPLSNAPITLHMTADTDVAYKTICRLAGINVVMDPEFRPEKLTVDLADVTLHQALDLVRLQSKTYWRPVLANTIFVTSDSPQKRKELEQNVMKTFYLRNITSPAELQEAASVVKQILDVNRVQVLQEQDALILRGTQDQMVLAEKLLADIDKPRSEVVLDIAVMEVSRTRIRTLGTTVPTSTSVGYLPASGGSSGATSGAITLGSFTVSVPGASFTALASDSNTKILQSPQIRAMNDQKATLRIGDRVPIATGSFSPGVVGGGSVSALVSTQFQYLDVGVNIDITPHIHSDREVTLKMVLEISTVTGTQDIGGITQPVIGQRRIEHESRLVDGEVNVLGGILNDTDTQSMSGYPWISRIPILKYLFSQENKQRNESEIVFAVTPHIIRALEVTDENERMIAVGTGTATELRRNTAPAVPAASAHPGTPAKPQQPATQKPAVEAVPPGSSRLTPPQVPAVPQTKPGPSS
jgi:general secretion pathway protein D